MGRWEDLKEKYRNAKYAAMYRKQQLKEKYQSAKEKVGDVREKAGDVKEKGSRVVSILGKIILVIIAYQVFGSLFNSTLAAATEGVTSQSSASIISASSGPLPLVYDTPLTTYAGTQIGKAAGPAIVKFGNTPVGEVPLRLLGSQVGCWFGNSFVPSEVIKQQSYSPTKAWNECKKLTVKEKADEIGCTNCYSITNFKLETIGVQKAVMSLALDTPEGKQYCRNIGGVQKCEDISSIKNPKLSVLHDSSKATLKGLQLEGENIKFAGKYEIGPTAFPLDVRAEIPLSCTTKGFKPKAIFTYDYQASGSASLAIRKDSSIKVPTIQNPVTFPGPIKLDVIPRPKEFAFDRDAEISVTIALRNPGNGEAKINSVILRQNPPLQLAGKLLTFTGCIGPYRGEVDGKGTKIEKIKIPPFVSTIGKKQESSNVVCIFMDENREIENSIQDISTYSFEATADYVYQITKDGEAVTVEEVLTCTVPTTGWKTLQREKGQGEPDNLRLWALVDYDDTGWNTVNLPDIGKCSGCSRYYRKLIIPVIGQDMFLNVASDDGALCILSNKDGIKNLWSEDFINDEHPLGKRTQKYNCAAGSSFDYCVKLNDFGLKSGETNVVSCKINNLKGDDVGFAISTEAQAVASQTPQQPVQEQPQEEG